MSRTPPIGCLWLREGADPEAHTCLAPAAGKRKPGPRSLLYSYVLPLGAEQGQSNLVFGAGGWGAWGGVGLLCGLIALNAPVQVCEGG